MEEPQRTAKSSPTKKQQFGQTKKKSCWGNNDVNLLRIILEFFFNKLEILINEIETKEKILEAKQCQLMAMDVSKRKTYRQLINGFQSHICGIFGYSEIAVLFYDNKTDTLFTLPLTLD